MSPVSQSDILPLSLPPSLPPFLLCLPFTNSFALHDSVGGGDCARLSPVVRGRQLRPWPRYQPGPTKRPHSNQCRLQSWKNVPLLFRFSDFAFRMHFLVENAICNRITSKGGVRNVALIEQFVKFYCLLTPFV